MNGNVCVLGRRPGLAVLDAARAGLHSEQNHISEDDRKE